MTTRVDGGASLAWISLDRRRTVRVACHADDVYAIVLLAVLRDWPVAGTGVVRPIQARGAWLIPKGGGQHDRVVCHSCGLMLTVLLT